jgi:hypothetical protein
MYRTRSPIRQSSPSAGPIVAFLLVASFGLLFVTGCSSTVRGPDAKEREDTFTAEDAERLQNAVETELPMAASGSTSVAVLEPGRVEGIVSSEKKVADPDLVRKYDLLRMSASSNQGGNAYRVVNDFLNVRATPSVSGAFVVRLNQGDVVSLVEFVNAGWAKISLAGGKEGYIATRYIAKIACKRKRKPLPVCTL